jgi:hypothetical protein
MERLFSRIKNQSNFNVPLVGNEFFNEEYAEKVLNIISKNVLNGLNSFILSLDSLLKVFYFLLDVYSRTYKDNKKRDKTVDIMLKEDIKGINSFIAISHLIKSKRIKRFLLKNIFSDETPEDLAKEDKYLFKRYKEYKKEIKDFALMKLNQFLSFYGLTIEEKDKIIYFKEIDPIENNFLKDDMFRFLFISYTEVVDFISSFIIKYIEDFVDEATENLRNTIDGGEWIITNQFMGLSNEIDVVVDYLNGFIPFSTEQSLEYLSEYVNMDREVEIRIVLGFPIRRTEQEKTIVENYSISKDIYFTIKGYPLNYNSKIPLISDSYNKIDEFFKIRYDKEFNKWLLESKTNFQEKNPYEKKLNIIEDLTEQVLSDYMLVKSYIIEENFIKLKLL